MAVDDQRHSGKYNDAKSQYNHEVYAIRYRAGNPKAVNIK